MKRQSLLLILLLLLIVHETFGQIGIAGPDKLHCRFATSVMLTPESGYIAYVWSPSTSLSDSTLQNPMASPSQTTTYTLSAFDGVNWYTDEMTVHYSYNNNYSGIGINETDTSLCNYSTVTLTTDLGDSAVWYDDLTEQTYRNDTLEIFVTGDHSIRLLVSNSGGCILRDYVQVTGIGPELDINVAGGSCSAGTGDVEVLETSGINAPYNILWDDGDTSFVRDSVPTGFYSFTVTDSIGCTSIGEIDLGNTINSFDLFVSDNILCADDTVQAVIGNNGSGMYTYQKYYYTVGTNTSIPLFHSYPAVFGDNSPSARLQLLYKASELSSVGLTAGDISKIAFEAIDVGSTPRYCNYQVAIQHTNITEVSDTMLPAGQTVLYPSRLFVNEGWNELKFDESFYWDGISNILIDICYDNKSGTNSDDPVCNGAFPNNGLNTYTQTSYMSVLYNRSYRIPQCGLDTIGNKSDRLPNIRFYRSELRDSVVVDQISWSNTAGISDSTILNPIFSPESTTTYYLTITDTAGCIYKDSVSFVVSDIEAQATAEPTLVPCGVNNIDLVANESSSYPIIDYDWSGLYGLSSANISPTNLGVFSSTLGYTQVQLVITDQFGCQDVSTVDIVRDPDCLIHVTGFIFDDRDSNCIYDHDDVPIPGVLVNAEFDQNVYTDVNGFYQFTSYSSGSVVLDITMPSGYHNTCNIDLTNVVIPIDTSLASVRLGDISFTSDSIVVSGVDEPKLTEVSIYPDPANDVLNVSSNKPISSLMVVDLTGRKVYSNVVGGNTFKISTSGFAWGSYILVVTDETGNAATRKFSVAH